MDVDSTNTKPSDSPKVEVEKEDDDAAVATGDDNDAAAAVGDGGEKIKDDNGDTNVSGDEDFASAAEDHNENDGKEDDDDDDDDDDTPNVDDSTGKEKATATDKSSDKEEVDINNSKDETIKNDDAPKVKESATSSTPTKRPRPADNDNDADDEETTPAAKKRPPTKEVQDAIAKYKLKKGTTYNVTYQDEPDPSTDNNNNNGGDNAPFGINFASVRVKNAHSYLIHYYTGPSGENYRGRPPSISNSAVIVESVLEDAPSETKLQGVRANDLLLFIDDRLVNLTDKKRLKYYMARLNKPTRPMKLTFFRPEEGDLEEEEEGNDEAVEDLAMRKPSEVAVYLSAKKGGAAASGLVSGEAVGKDEQKALERQLRRKVLESRLEHLEALQAETTAEIAELRRKDGVHAMVMMDTSTDDIKEGVLFEDDRYEARHDDEDVFIPPHIMYYPPTKIRRKKLKSLNDACNRVETILRQRQVIDKEADKIRVVVNEAQSRLDVKEKELLALDEKLAPALEEVKFIEMEVKDNWKNMYLKLKEYYEKFGHSNVMEKEDTKLSKWITRQRTCYANAQLEEPNPAMGIIKPYQYDLLNKLEFCWNPREQQFVQNVNMLRAYKHDNGHTNVPMKYENIHLANFVQKWRREYRLFQEGKPSNMSQDRLQILEDAGFTWRDPSRQRKRSDTRQETWAGFLSQLADFKEEHGHFMVNKVNKTKQKGNKLGRLDEFCSWVRKQYILFKEGSPCQLTETKVNQLKDMGFWLERGQVNKYLKKESLQKEEDDGAILESRVEVPEVPKIEAVGEEEDKDGKMEEDTGKGTVDGKEKPDEKMTDAKDDNPRGEIMV